MIEKFILELRPKWKGYEVVLVKKEEEVEEEEDDVKIVLLILQAIGKLPFKISVNEAKAIKRLSENVGELLE